MRKRPRMLSIVLIAAFISGGAASALAQSAPEYDAGLRYFQAGKFSQAATYFQQALQRHPRSPLVHYNYANALVKLKEHQRAVQEYRVAYMLEPTGAVSGFCRTALTAYKSKVPDAKDIAAFSGSGHDTAGGAGIAGQPPLNQGQTLANRQLEQERLKLAERCEAAKRTAMQIAETRIRRMEADAADEIAHLNDVVSRPGMINGQASMIAVMPDPEYVRRREAEIRAAVADKKDVILRETEEQNKKYDEKFKKEELAMTEVAANLAAQVNTTSRSGVKMESRGSNLYVRQYTPFNAPAASNAHSAVARIGSARSAPPDDTLPPNNSSTRVTSKVLGR